MRYESEILYDLMKRDGLLNPSQDHLPYESELKEKYVNEVKGAYPKLNDYRAEWLNYNKCEYIPADFPTESQTNQTSGTFQNVIPFAYDVATLKGQTLVNLKGMQSTVNPKLITVGKNLINGDEFLDYPSKFIASFDSTANTISLTSIAKNKEELGTYPHINIKVVENGLGGKRVKLSFEIIERTSEEACVEFSYLSNGKRNYLKRYESGQYSINLPTDTSEIQVKVLAYNTTKHLNAKVVVKNLMLTAYPDLNEYDKYHEITASANVTLRGVNGVQDELDLLTGELTQRIKERVLNGEESWENASNSDVLVDVSRFKLRLTDAKNNNAKLISDKFKYNNTSLINDEICYFGGDYTLYVNIRKNKLSEDSLTGFKSWLSNNPLTIQYELGNPSVKTVDLTIIDEDNAKCSLIPFEDVTTYETSSDTIPPLADLTVCVEATTQNLASFVHLEGVEENE